MMVVELSIFLTDYNGLKEILLSFFMFVLMLRSQVISLKVLASMDKNHAIPSLPSIRVMKYYFKTLKFSEIYANLWGGKHQNVSKDESAVTLTLDNSSGNTLLFSYDQCLVINNYMVTRFSFLMIRCLVINNYMVTHFSFLMVDV